METIKKEELKDWLINDIFKNVSSCTTCGKSKEFDKRAKNFDRETASMLVNSEYIVDWADDERETIPIDEVIAYSKSFQKRILSGWLME